MRCEHCGKDFTSDLGLKLHLEKPSCPVLKQAAEVEKAKPEPRPFKPRALVGGAMVWQR